MARSPRRTKDPMLGGGSVGTPPELQRRQIFDDLGSYGLRAYSGYVREEFLPQLMGRQAQRVYREMLDNSSVVGAVMFAIMQAMRRVTWRVEPVSDKGDAKAAAEFVESLMADMSHTWEDFVVEALSMLGYGFSIHEIVYKRRLGRRPHSRPGPKPQADMGSSAYDDGKIGWRRLPIRAQDTIIKWFFDPNGQVQGYTQQPYAGPLIDAPIEKAVLFRAGAHKNNPEGRSILRNAYRAYYFIKRLEELEAIAIERMNGFPVISAPSSLIEKAQTVGANGQPTDPVSAAAYAEYKRIATNIRVDEQMGLVLPSDVWQTADGKPSSQRLYQLEFLTPQHGANKGGSDTNAIIGRYKIDIMMTVLADFIQMGHEVRGTNNLAVTKVDMFYQAIEGWLNSQAAVLNRYALPRLWRLNGDDFDLMPQFKPDMAQRLDLDSLGDYVANLKLAGMPLFPDEDLQKFLREAGGMPEETAPEAMAAAAAVIAQAVDGANNKSKPNIRTNGKNGKKPKTDSAGAEA
jgi:hypothetical protein